MSADADSAAERRTLRYFFLLTILFAATLVFSGLGVRELTSGDETRVAGITAEMFLERDYVTPRLNGVNFLEYPPLYYWCASASAKIFGLGEAAVKLPSAFAAFGCAVILFLLALRLRWKPAAAGLASAVLLTSAQFFANSRTCMVDMLLAFFVLLAWYAFYALWNTPSRAARVSFFLLFVLAISGGVMTKGMPGFIFPVSSLGIWLVLSDVRDRKFHFWRYFFLGIALPLSMIPGAFWAWRLYLAEGSDALYAVAVTNSIGRLSGAQGDHVEPFFYYLKRLPGQFFPWLILLPVSFWFAWKCLRDKKRPELLFPLCCLLVPYILLTVAASKRQVYLLPLYAPCALLTAWLLSEILYPRWGALADAGRFPRGRALVKPCFAVLWTLFMLVLAAMVPRDDPRAYVFPAVALFLVLFGMFWKHLTFRERLLDASLGIAVGFAAIDTSMLAWKAEQESLRPLFEDCRMAESRGANVVLIGQSERTRGAAYFYGRRNFEVRNLTPEQYAAGPSGCDFWVVRSKREKRGIAYADSHRVLFPPSAE